MLERAFGEEPCVGPPTIRSEQNNLVRLGAPPPCRRATGMPGTASPAASASLQATAGAPRPARGLRRCSPRARPYGMREIVGHAESRFTASMSRFQHLYDES